MITLSYRPNGMPNAVLDDSSILGAYFLKPREIPEVIDLMNSCTPHWPSGELETCSMIRDTDEFNSVMAALDDPSILVFRRDTGGARRIDATVTYKLLVSGSKAIRRKDGKITKPAEPVVLIAYCSFWDVRPDLAPEIQKQITQAIFQILKDKLPPQPDAGKIVVNVSANDLWKQIRLRNLKFRCRETFAGKDQNGRMLDVYQFER